MQISVDGSDFVQVGLEHLVGKTGTDRLSGQQIATELTNVIQERFGDGAIAPEKLEPALVRRFVMGEGRCWSAGAVRVAGGAVGTLCLRHQC